MEAALASIDDKRTEVVHKVHSEVLLALKE